VLEDKRVMFESSYYDPNDTNIPQYIKKLFDEGAPADFLLIGATTRDASEISPALRSRCAEIYFEPLGPAHIQEIVKNSTAKLGVALEPGLSELISEYTVEGRKATSLLADAYAMSVFEAGPEVGDTIPPLTITQKHLYEVLQTSRMTPYVTHKASLTLEVGRVMGLGVSSFLGSIIEIEAMSFPARDRGKGYVRFNDAAGSMAKDSVFNATSVLRKLTGEEVTNYDLHINVIGGGRIEGPSAGLAVTLAILSSIKGWGVKQDVAVTGEISIQGQVKPVGGLNEKIYGAKRAGVNTVVIPRDNLKDVPMDIKGINIVPVSCIEEALPLVFDQVRPVGLVI
jgi:ATP-dependent Lon protease